jgi:Protein of unknown function (DUF2946)
MTLALTSQKLEGRPSGTRRLCAFLVAAILLIANYSQQTHIHGAAVDMTFVHVAVSSSHGSPANEEATCPLCQAAATSGMFLLPALQTLAIPGEFTLRAQAFASRLLIGIPTIGWTARGPPRF